MAAPPRAVRRLTGAFLACLCALVLPTPAALAHAGSIGRPAQIAWVRSAASRFLSAELHRDAAGACTILNSPMRATVRHRTCEQRWAARIASTLTRPGGRAALRRELRAVPSARVVVAGEEATISLPEPLVSAAPAGTPSRLRWTESCWMIEG
jgi:hypothetical protein